MAWRSHGATNVELVKNLRGNGIISSDRVANAMMKIDRKNYVLDPSSAYYDRPQPIGYSVTISAPHMHAYALEVLKDHLKSGNSALDIGSGSGYLTAAMATMIESNGIVVGIEHMKELVTKSIENIKKGDENLLDKKLILIIEGDGRKGYSEKAPYDCIHVGAASDGTPKLLLEQLKVGGRAVIPVDEGDGNQYLIQYDKVNEKEVKSKKLMGVIYVPLTDANKQRRKDL
ncbi:hypothetical protein SNEBB_011238 [Seison nebaliae]|nr:hypothetical protein SNEBB_011238 [Seison nebaliae]